MNTQLNHDLAMRILHEMPKEKKQSLSKALDRNQILTSTRSLSDGLITIYKEGWYLQLKGTRSQFSIYAQDNDGEFIFKRKPSETTLHKLYTQSLNFTENDYQGF